MLDTLSVRILVTTVLEFTSVSDLGNLACCSTYMRVAADNQSLWRRRYVTSRKKRFQIGPNSVHQPYRDMLECRFTRPFILPYPMLRGTYAIRHAARAQWAVDRAQWAQAQVPEHVRWVAAGYPCTNVRHFEHGTLLEVGKRATNYHNFKRAYAKTAKSKLRVHTRTSNEVLQRAQWQLEEAQERLQRIKKTYYGMCQPGAHLKFAAILALPPSTPPHLRMKPRKTKK